jgi:hypothetical protein
MSKGERGRNGPVAQRDGNGGVELRGVGSEAEDRLTLRAI